MVQALWAFVGDGARAAETVVELEDGTTERYEFDAAGRLTLLKVDAPGESGDFTELYDWDEHGRLLRWVHDAAGDAEDVEELYDFDADSRLVFFVRLAADGSQLLVENYDYDPAGRLIYKLRDYGNAGYSYASYGYDAEGRLNYLELREYPDVTRDVTEWYEYDSQGRLISLKRDAHGTDGDFSETYR